MANLLSLFLAIASAAKRAAGPNAEVARDIANSMHNRSLQNSQTNCAAWGDFSYRDDGKSHCSSGGRCSRLASRALV
jgi:hypothetical protein